MFKINNDKSIYITRGDTGIIEFGATDGDSSYVFGPDDIIRFQVFEKKHHENVVIRKEIKVTDDTDIITISLTKDDTKIGEIINKPVDYWYEIELNPDTTPQTLIGYDDDGPKVFRLFPEGADKK